MPKNSGFGKSVNELGKEIMSMVLEAQDRYLVEHRKERPGWVIHEGVEEDNQERRLRRVRYFSGPYKTIDDLWYAVLDYIESEYELEQIERTFIKGGGASWIRSGAEIILKSVFVLDRFYLNKNQPKEVGSRNGSEHAHIK